jgi:hypothetical protein
VRPVGVRDGVVFRLSRWIGRRDPVRLAASALIAAQTGWWAALVLPGHFQRDDYFYIDRARDAELWDWLGRIYWEHFAPGHRLVFWLLPDSSGTSWVVLQLAVLTAFAAGLIFFYRTLELLYGRSWWLLVPLAVTGFAWQFSLGFSWPSAGLQVIPEFTFGTLCMYAFLRYLHGRHWRWLALAGVAFTAGLAFYIRVLLVPVLLLVIRYLFLERSLRTRVVARTLWAGRAAWLVFVVPAVVYLSHFWQVHAFESPPPDSASAVFEYLRNAWVRNVAPGFLGVRFGSTVSSDAGRTIAGIAGQILVVLVVWLSFARKRAAALRAWTYIGVAVGATLWLTARGKVGVVGPGAGYDPRYVANLCWQVPLGVVFALHPRRVLELAARWPPPDTQRDRRLVIRPALVASAVCVAIGFALESAHSVETDWQAHGDKARIAAGRPHLP